MRRQKALLPLGAVVSSCSYSCADANVVPSMASGCGPVADVLHAHLRAASCVSSMRPLVLGHLVDERLRVERLPARVGDRALELRVDDELAVELGPGAALHRHREAVLGSSVVIACPAMVVFVGSAASACPALAAITAMPCT